MAHGNDPQLIVERHLDFVGLKVVMAGRHYDDELGSPWRVALYTDEHADSAQQSALAAVFLVGGGR